MSTTRIEFTNELGEQHVNIRVFKVVPWGLAQALQNVGDLEKDDAAKLRFAERVACALVVDGNVMNAWTGEPMSFPLNEKTVGEAPAEMIMAVFTKFGEMKAEADAAAKKPQIGSGES
jgi:hypothetical protein